MFVSGLMSATAKNVYKRLPIGSKAELPDKVVFRATNDDSSNQSRVGSDTGVETLMTALSAALQTILH